MTVTPLPLLGITPFCPVRGPRRDRARRERRTRHAQGRRQDQTIAPRRTGHTLPGRITKSRADLVTPGYVARRAPGPRRRRRRL